MLQFTIKEDFRTFKKDTTISIDLDKIYYTTFVGLNGTGKSTLFQTLRGYTSNKKEVNLKFRDLKEYGKYIDIETDYKKFYFLDIVFDDPSDMNNAYDACSYIDSGNFRTRNLSHGQKSLEMFVNFISKLPEKPEEKSLIVLDEVDVGFDLRFQNAYLNGIKKLMGKGYHIIVITHNVLVMLNGSFVYDLSRALKGEEPFVEAKKYINEIIPISNIFLGTN